MHHRFVSLGGRGGVIPTQNYYLSLCRALTFFIRLGTHPSKTGEELVYYHLYHEKYHLPLHLTSTVKQASYRF